MGPFTCLLSDVSAKELSLSLDAGMTQEMVLEALKNLQGYFGLKKLELRAAYLEIDGWTAAAHALSGAAIHMTMLASLSVPENFVTEILLLHISLLPHLEELSVLPATPANDLPGKQSNGFEPLLSLDVPNERLLQRFLCYAPQNLKTLKVANLGQNSLRKIARTLPGLQRLYVEGSSFGSPEIFVLGACFQLEEIEIHTDYALGMNGSDLRQFKSMFRNLRSLSIVPRDS